MYSSIYGKVHVPFRYAHPFCSGCTVSIPLRKVLSVNYKAIELNMYQ